MDNNRNAAPDEAWLSDPEGTVDLLYLAAHDRSFAYRETINAAFTVPTMALICGGRIAAGLPGLIDTSYATLEANHDSMMIDPDSASAYLFSAIFTNFLDSLQQRRTPREEDTGNDEDPDAVMLDDTVNGQEEEEERERERSVAANNANEEIDQVEEMGQEEREVDEEMYVPEMVGEEEVITLSEDEDASDKESDVIVLDDDNLVEEEDLEEVGIPAPRAPSKSRAAKNEEEDQALVVRQKEPDVISRNIPTPRASRKPAAKNEEEDKTLVVRQKEPAVSSRNIPTPRASRKPAAKKEEEVIDGNGHLREEKDETLVVREERKTASAVISRGIPAPRAPIMSRAAKKEEEDKTLVVRQKEPAVSSRNISAPRAPRKVAAKKEEEVVVFQGTSLIGRRRHLREEEEDETRVARVRRGDAIPLSIPAIRSSTSKTKKCDHCHHLVYADPASILQHTWECHREQVCMLNPAPDLVCTVAKYCDWISPTVEDRIAHELEHEEPFDDEDDVLVEFGQGTNHCVYCGFRINRISYVKKHMQTCGRRDKRPMLACTHCNEPFHYVCDFVDHLELNHRYAPYIPGDPRVKNQPPFL